MVETKIITLKISSELLAKFERVSTKDVKSTPIKPTPIKPTPIKPKRAISPITIKASTPTSKGPEEISENSSRGVRKWIKKPLEVQSFTGYTLKFNTWNGGLKTLGDSNNNSEDQDFDIKTENNASKPNSLVKKGSGLKLQIKLNKKVFKLNKNKSKGSNDDLDEEYDDDNDEEADAIEDYSSIISSTDISRVTTPAIND
ncbi:hypothetical protein WICMUC_000257 [Wickerhamomyces mucosus]|uniref:Uncharacterized protein n=1 Tax=Wickerhamomyces mucosus TaxID=1378264 RepID=A0A9P8TJE7_9ASCO|nr:hypothetical protein WICMUC_000257 [Wickerhamomyces mucosus]